MAKILKRKEEILEHLVELYGKEDKRLEIEKLEKELLEITSEEQQT